jgi:hypothetical protein
MIDLMRKTYIPTILLLFASFSLTGTEANHSGNDTIDVQKLYNGRAWKNIYYKIKGDQFLFTTDFITGSLTIDNKEYRNLRLKYDIYNDELISINDHGIMLQMNKEMIDRFSLNYNDRLYNFKRIDSDTTGSMKGFVNILYEGKSALYAKYMKEILLLPVENKYDLFNQLTRVFFVKDGSVYRINSRREFMGLVKDHKAEVRQFIRSNKIKLSKKIPESFKPVAEYYDKVRQ